MIKDQVPPFWRRRSAHRVFYGLGGIFLVSVYGAIGYLVLGWSVSDSVFQVIVTISGVGLGAVRPIETTLARAHTMVMIALGISAVAFTMAALVQAITESELLNYYGRRRMRKQVEALSGHTVVAGHGRVGSLVCAELVAAGQPFVVVELDPSKRDELEGRGYAIVTGDATEETVLREAGIERAQVLVTAMPNDAENVFITLTGRQMRPGLLIIARAEQPSSVQKLKHAGANHVVSPAAIGAHRIVSLVTNPGAVQFAELVTHRTSVAIEMDEMPIPGNCWLVGQTLRDADVKRRTGVIVVAIKRQDGRLDFPPTGDELLEAGDSVVALGRRDELDQFRKYCLQTV